MRLQASAVTESDLPTNSNVNYVGRFAPSPTGPLHFGSAVAAIASYLDARASDGTWLIRIEDLDPPREQAGAADLIIAQLAALGMESDLSVMFQSTRHEFYLDALESLRHRELVFPCGCTRREIGNTAYPGTCRSGLPTGKPPRSERFRVPAQEISFTDLFYGPQTERLLETVGDFNLLRADGLFSYHLAVVIDDEDQGISHVVRGEDLLSSTARQLALQHALGFRTPRYRHFPVVKDEHGVKLSKQTGAKQINVATPEQIWLDALNFLAIPNVEEFCDLPLHELIDQAVSEWRSINQAC